LTDQLPHAGQAPGEHDRRIPSLDGLRAISILMVLLWHARSTNGFPARQYDPLAVVDFGNLGVRVFFVISGFLITGLLLRERERRGRISLRHFYFRRVFRIFPAYFAFIAVVLAFVRSGWLPPIERSTLVHAATFTMNYARHSEWAIGHFWSLSVEEQFYLLWPPILALAGTRRAFHAALAYVLLVPVLRLALFLFVPGYYADIGAAFETVGDAIAVGCLLARYRDDLWSRKWYRDLLTSRWMLLVPLLVLVAAALDGRPRISYLVGIPVKNVGIALLIDWAVRFPAGRVGAVLNSRLAVWIGTMSYSLYVWQQPFLDRRYEAGWIRFPLNVVYAFVVALLSYVLIERPMLRLRATIERRGTPRGRPHGAGAPTTVEALSADGRLGMLNEE
jgi:peptidoglycan/LPS O-acetylase OafA/YrhL